MSEIGPNLWFGVTVAGILLLYWEFVWPGRVAPAAAGVFLLLFGAYHLATLSPVVRGIGLLVLATILFLSELWIDSGRTGGIGGTVALALGARWLYCEPHRIHTGAAVLGALLVGPLTMFLTRRARTARWNKRVDL